MIYLLLVTFVSVSLSAGSSPNDRFSNFYSQPENLKLIAVASENHPSAHHRQSDEPRFSIGLGTLAPSYSQKFGLDGRTRLDFNHRNDGFSYSLTNHHHPEPTENERSSGYGSGSDDDSQESSKVFRHFSPNSRSHLKQPNINIYHNQDIIERYGPQSQSETRQFFTRAISPMGRGSFGGMPRQGFGGMDGDSNGGYGGYGGGENSPGDLIPSPEKYRELVDNLAPKGRDNGDSDEGMPSMGGRGGFSYHSPGGSSIDPGYRSRASRFSSHGAPDSSPYKQYQSNYHVPESRGYDPKAFNIGPNDYDGSTGLGGFSESSLDLGNSFRSEDGSNFSPYEEETPGLSPFQSQSDDMMAAGMPRAFEYTTTINSSPVGRSEETLGPVYLAGLNQYGYNDALVNDQTALNMVAGLNLWNMRDAKGQATA